MKICKAVRAAAIVFTIGSILAPLSAQNGTASSGGTKQSASVTPPLMPTPPSMPVITTPSSSAPHYTGGQSASSQRQTSSGGTSAEVQAQELQQTPTGKTQSAQADRSKNLSAVSAADLTALANKGLLNNFYSLLGSAGNDALLSGGLTSSAMQQGGMLPSSSNAMLERILSELAEVKKQNADAVKSDEEEPRANPAPGILRFIVNGYDVLASCRTVYFSDVGEDGTFLLTGDRTYTANGQKRTETFYLLFRPAGGAGFSTQYKAEIAVVQDYTNAHSFMYRLASLGDLTATKTGNLVSLRTSDPNCRADLLIDIGGAKRP